MATRGRQFCAIVLAFLVVVVLITVLVYEKLLGSDLIPLEIGSLHRGGNRTGGSLIFRTAGIAAHGQDGSNSSSAAFQTIRNRSNVSPPADEDQSNMKGFHFCLSDSIRLPDSSKSSGALRNATIPLFYQCRGEAYDRFAQNMTDYVFRTHSSKNHSLWGRREFPLPDNATILALGNSHTRQTMYAMFCQYAHHITRVQRFNFPDAPIDEYVFANGASLVLTSNSPLVYSRTWHELLRKYDPLHRPLSSSYDALILGAFNKYNRDSTANFHKQMLAYQSRFPDEVKYTTVPPPTLSSVASLFPRPIVALPMFAEYGMSWERSSVAARSKLSPSSRQSTVVVVHSRAHIEALHHECGSDGMTDIGLCWNRDETTPYGRKPSDMHRCTGPQGGHPDLLAWDVVEALHRLLPGTGR